MDKMTDDQRTTLQTLQARLRAIHDEVHDILLPGGDCNAFSRSLRFGPVGFETGIVSQIEAIGTGLYSLDAYLHAMATSMGDYSTVAIGPTHFERARARREADSRVA